MYEKHLTLKQSSLTIYDRTGGLCMEGKVRGILYRDPGTYSLGIKNTSHIVHLPCIYCLSNKKEGGNFYKSSRDLVKVPMMKSDLFIF